MTGGKPGERVRSRYSGNNLKTIKNSCSMRGGGDQRCRSPRSDGARGSVSRVLSTPWQAMGGHSSSPGFASGVEQPTRAPGRNDAHVAPLFGLAPGGVCQAGPVTRPAVRSCRTLSPLPARDASIGGLLSVALSLGSPPAGVTRHRRFRGARTFLAGTKPPRPPDPLAFWPIAPGRRYWKRHRSAPPPDHPMRLSYERRVGERARRRNGSAQAEPQIPPQSSPCGLGRSNASRIMRSSASISPSISSGRKRRWNAMIAAIGSLTS